MKVAIIHDALVNRGGAERVVTFMHEAFPEAPIFTSVYLPDQTFPEFRSATVKTLAGSFLARNENQAKMAFPLWALGFRCLDLSSFDVVLSSTTFAAKYVSPPPSTPHVCYCYAPFRFIWNTASYSIASLPFSETQLRMVRPFVPLLRKFDRRAMSAVDYIATSCRNMANAIQETYGRPAEIIYPPIRLADYGAPTGSGSYYLAVSRLVSHKRIDLAVAACEELGRPLVVVGDGPEMANLRKLGSSKTEFRGKVADAELRELYRNCRALLFPSREDYGLVPLEAQACGKAVVAFGVGGVLETVVDGVTGVFFPEQSVAAVRSAILKFESSSFDPDIIRQSVEGFDVAGFKSHLQDFVARAWRESSALKSKRTRSRSGEATASRPKPSVKAIETTQRPLRLLFLNHNVVRFGGTFYRALDIARFLVQCGHSVTLMSISPTARLRSSTEMVDGVEIIHTPDLFWGIGRSGWDLWDAFVRIRLAGSRRWDLIHAWDSRPVVILPALAARWFSRREGAKLIIDWSDWWGRGGTQMERGGGWTRYLYNAIETFFEEQFRRFADGTTVISTLLRDRATALGVDREKILLLSQGCDDSSAQPQISRETARESLGVSPEEHLFVTVGVLNVSDAKLLFESIEIVLRRMPAIRFRLVGRTRSPVPAHLAALGVQQIGYVPSEDLDLYMAAADALLVPLADNVSSRARWPSRVNVAMSRGVPVIITRVGDLPVLLEREEAAFIAQPNPADFAERIIEAATRPEDLRRLRAAGKRVAAKRLPWNEIIARLEKFYFRVLGDTFHDDGDSIRPVEEVSQSCMPAEMGGSLNAKS